LASADTGELLCRIVNEALDLAVIALFELFYTGSEDDLAILENYACVRSAQSLVEAAKTELVLIF